MTITTKRLIGEFTCQMYKSSCVYAEDRENPEMIEFVREDVVDWIGFSGRKTGDDVSELLEAVNAAETIPAIYAALESAGCAPVQWCDTYGYTMDT